MNHGIVFMTISQGLEKNIGRYKRVRNIKILYMVRICNACGKDGGITGIISTGMDLFYQLKSRDHSLPPLHPH